MAHYTATKENDIIREIFLHGKTMAQVARELSESNTNSVTYSLSPTELTSQAVDFTSTLFSKSIRGLPWVRTRMPLKDVFVLSFINGFPQVDRFLGNILLLLIVDLSSFLS